jgi:uncharacterized protein YqjF (DUF2071 family)
MRMRWVDLLFAHWRVDLAQLRPLIPAELEIDTFDGEAYVGVVPFLMEDVSPRGLPALGSLSRFPEVNVRTYVRHRDLAGVWFFSLDAGERIAVETARRGFHLPYFHARMMVARDGESVVYRSERIDRRGPPASLSVRYRATGPVTPAAAGSLDAWLTERYRLFAADGRGRLSTTSIAHRRWPLRPASAEFDVETLSAAQGLTLVGPPVHLAFADRLDVRGWWPRALGGAAAAKAARRTPPR